MRWDYEARSQMRNGHLETTYIILANDEKYGEFKVTPTGASWKPYNGKVPITVGWPTMKRFVMENGKKGTLGKRKRKTPAIRLNQDTDLGVE